MNCSDMKSGAPNRVRSLLASLIVAAASLAGTSGPLLAQESGGVVKDTGAAQRIDLTERVRSLSQRIGAASCFAQAGVDPEGFKKIAGDSMAEFNAIMAALENGDEAYGVTGKEEERKVAAGIRGVNLQWDTFKTAATGLLDGSAEANGYDYVARQNLNLMHSTKYLVAEIINTYANPPELLQSDALTLDIVGRQRSLAQQLAKESCGVVHDQKVTGSTRRMAKSTRLFEASLNALRNGFPAAGVTPPPSDEIAAGLEAIATEWEATKAELAKVTGPGTVDDATAVLIFQKLDAISAKFDDLTVLYVAASKSGL